MNIPIISGFIKLVNELGGKWLDKKRAVADGAIKVATATAEANAQVAVTKATAELEWEAAMAKSSQTSWKDEAWTVFIIGILSMSFIPGMDKYVQQGFENISLLPEWFGYVVMLGVSAAFGKNVLKEFTSLATNRKSKEAVINASIVKRK